MYLLPITVACFLNTEYIVTIFAMSFIITIEPNRSVYYLTNGSIDDIINFAISGLIKCSAGVS